MPRGRLSATKHLQRAQVNQTGREEIVSGLGELQNDLAESGDLQGAPTESVTITLRRKGYTAEQIQEFLNQPALEK